MTPTARPGSGATMLAVLVFLGVCSTAAARTYKIEGCATDETGKPVAALVTITGQAGEGSYRVQTARNGCFTYAGLPEGRYVVSARPRTLPSPPSQTVALSENTHIDFAISRVTARIPGPVVKGGSGFVVSLQGHILTDHHVIDGCTEVRATLEGKQQLLTVVAYDRVNDLAVLKASMAVGTTAQFSSESQLKLGLPVVAVGYPLQSILASSMSLTTGVLSSTAGPGNDTRLAQFTAPVNPGSSGGPLLDMEGHVVGVVVSKLDALRIALLTGDVPQGVNFAIKIQVARLFLDLHNVEYKVAGEHLVFDTVGIGELAQKFALPIECR